MAISIKTQEEFRQCAAQALGFELSQTEATQLLDDIVRYYRLLGELSEKIENPQ
jgi:hypothetical protein